MAVREMKSALVAGGAGFLGSHLCDALLADGYRVICIDNLLTGRPDNIAHLAREPRFNFIEADIIDAPPNGLAVDRVYNLACAASPPRYQADPEHTMLTNVLGTRNLLRLAEASGARFLLASTSEIYGDPEIHPQPEHYRGNVSCTGPRACYDEGKRAAETLCQDFARAGRADIRIARIFNTYGPRMRPDDGRVISNAVNQALAGHPVTVFGDGSQTRSFCYVADLIDGLMRLMEHDGPLPGPVNLGNETEITVRMLAETVIRETGSAARIALHPLPVDDPRRRRPDTTLARTLLGWQAATPLAAGLAATIAWFAAERMEADGLKASPPDRAAGRRVIRLPHDGPADPMAAAPRPDPSRRTGSGQAAGRALGG